MLNGAAFGSDVVDFTADTTSPTNTGQFVAAIDIAAFGEVQDFIAAATRSFAEMRVSPPLPGHDPMRVPGDGREAGRAHRLAKGIALHQALRTELDRIAFNLAIPAL